MFFLTYGWSELRRRRGRTLLTAIGLGIGVGLVVAVNALSAGLDEAQDEVLEPLTGLGTDMTVTRPLDRGEQGGFGGQGLSADERDQLRDEVGPGRLDLHETGEPGEKFTRTNFVSAAQLSFGAAEVGRLAALGGVADAAGSLTLNAVTVSGTVPEGGFQPPQPGSPQAAPAPGAQRQSIDLDAMSITGVDASKPSLAPITPSQVSDGEYLSENSARQAVVNVAYARQHSVTVGDTVTLGDKKFEVVGLAQAPLGGSATDLYVKLSQLQAISDRKGRVNQVQVRAADADAVPAVAKAIERTLENASVTTAADLAERIGGSLVDAKSLSAKLGTALTLVALVAAFLIAALLTLSSVAKRVRELGTLKALGWPQRLVVRQVTGESVAQGLLGGVLGAAFGVGAATLIGAMGITLEASVAAAQGPQGERTVAGPDGGGPAMIGGPFGQGQVTSGSTEVVLGAPVDLTLLVIAIGLAVFGGLLAGGAGGLRAARLRPVDALRSIG